MSWFLTDLVLVPSLVLSLVPDLVPDWVPSLDTALSDQGLESGRLVILLLHGP